MINIGLCFENDSDLYFINNEICACFDQRGIDYNIYCCHSASELMRSAQRRYFNLFFYDPNGEYGLVRMAALHLKKLNPRLVSVVFQPRRQAKTEDNSSLEPIYQITCLNHRQLWTNAILAYEAALDEKNIFSYYRRPSYIHIPIKKILYFTSEARLVRVICDDSGESEHVFYNKLSSVEKLLSSKSCCFFRIHQSYLVNAKYIAAYCRTHVVLTSGERLPISRYEYFKAVNAGLCSKKLPHRNSLKAQVS